MVSGLDGDRKVYLYPELEDRLSTSTRRGPLIIMRDRPDKKRKEYLRYQESWFQHLAREIMDKAGLPRELTFTSFRHGGMTELGDAELTDQEMMALSAHKQRSMLTVYSKRTEKQRTAGAKKRLSMRTKRDDLCHTQLRLAPLAMRGYPGFGGDLWAKCMENKGKSELQTKIGQKVSVAYARHLDWHCATLVGTARRRKPQKTVINLGEKGDKLAKKVQLPLRGPTSNKIKSKQIHKGKSTSSIVANKLAPFPDVPTPHFSVKLARPRTGPAARTCIVNQLRSGVQHTRTYRANPDRSAPTSTLTVTGAGEVFETAPPITKSEMIATVDNMVTRVCW